MYNIYIVCFFLHNIERVHITYGYIFAYMRLLVICYFILFKYLFLSNQYDNT